MKSTDSSSSYKKEEDCVCSRLTRVIIGLSQQHGCGLTHHRYHNCHETERRVPLADCIKGGLLSMLFQGQTLIFDLLCVKIFSTFLSIHYAHMSRTYVAVAMGKYVPYKL